MSRLWNALRFFDLDPSGCTVLDLGVGAGQDLLQLKDRLKASFVDHDIRACVALRAQGIAGVRGDIYDLQVLGSLLPVDIVWSYASVAQSQWTERTRHSYVGWIDLLKKKAGVTMIVPHWSHEESRRVVKDDDKAVMDVQLREAGFKRWVVPGVSIEPMCPYLYLHDRAWISH